MKILKLKIKNKCTNWCLNEVDFFDSITLLVGLSGVGKTQILKSINDLKGISFGYSFNGLSWDVQFISDDNACYHWIGEFDTIDSSTRVFKSSIREGNDTEIEKPSILFESLYCDNKKVFERQKNVIKFNRKQVPRVSPFSSALHLFSDDPLIKQACDSLKKIHRIDSFSEYEECVRCSGCKNGKAKDKKKLIESIKFQTGHILGKLMVAYDFMPKEFEYIKNEFISVFPQVEDLRFYNISNDDPDRRVLQIKEKKTSWISHHQIASGMFKTLVFITEMRLLPEGSIILIDEFENSLGINCINSVATDVIQNNKLQFIITSHHPYIINSMTMDSWKIVTRKSHIVNTKDAKKYNLGKSNHEAFKQLLNLKDYYNGIL